MKLSTFRELLNKSIQVVQQNGLKNFLIRVYFYLQKKIKHEKSQGDPSRTFMDVLFVNGCALPHPARYRVTHQREQLFANSINSNEVFYENLSLDLVKNYRLFVFFRCPSTDVVEKFIKVAKENNKIVLFDIDDLVIDTKYTDEIEFIKSMKPEDKKLYDDGVNRMQSVLKMCDGVITTTERLAIELKNYVPEVFINRNTASEQMVKLSLEAIEEKKQKDNIQTQASISQELTIKIGYFSGSITHNDDINMIMPVLSRILDENQNVHLYFAGELDIPVELELYRNRVHATPFQDWKNLPQKIASVDINIAPLEDSIFNEAKSENKWVEAALVKVPTVASNIGAMRQMIQNGKTGILCSDERDWYTALSYLIQNKSARIEIGERAYQYVSKNCTTIYTGFPLAKFIKSKMKPNIAFILPTLQISGGVNVVLKHCILLKNAGWDVLIISEGGESKNIIKEGTELLVISKFDVAIHGSFDKAVATLWSTLSFLILYPAIKQRYYLVQGFETDFSEHGQYNKLIANQTYNAIIPINYITVSQWCQKWLKEKFDKNAVYAPNGLNLELFRPERRNFNTKIRILVEGNNEDYYKNVDESFKIIEKLDPQDYEIWFLSYLGKPKDWYRVDKFFYKVPYEMVSEIYSQCHILIKSSFFESFSYPPLEMMATGGYVVVVPNDGNSEYLIDGENCLLYELGDIDGAVEAIQRIISDNNLQDKLYQGGLKTAQNRSWSRIKNKVLNLYGIYDGDRLN